MEHKKEYQDLKKILDESDYSWIKIKKGPFFKDIKTEEADWKLEYHELCGHHMTETNFLIHKCRELAEYIINNKL